MATIVFTVTTDLTYDQRMERICAALSAHGFEVLIVGRKKGTSKELAETGYRQKRLRCFFEKGKLFYLEFNLRLFFYLLFVKADVISSVDLDTIFPGWLVSRIRGKKFVYDAHEYFTEVIELVHRPRIRRFWEKLEKFVLLRTVYAYTVSKGLKQEFEKKYPLKFEVIRNVPWLEKQEESPEPEKVLIYIGAVNAGRGLMELFEALQGTEVKLWICGDGDLYDALKEKARELKLETQVTFYGYVAPKQLKEITRRAYAGYLLLEQESLSYYYSLANKFFDYIHAGIPQLVIDFPEYRIINEKQQVALLTKLDKESIRANIERLWNDAALYDRLKANTEAAKREYNWQHESQKLIHFYQRVISSHEEK